MKEFTILTATALPLRADNIDTDQIIPAKFLKAVKREGFGDKLFYFWRFEKSGKLKKDSIFNDTRYKGAKILLTGENFGVGSSREHAVWAIYDYGFRAVIAASFGDIFYNNALKNGLLAVKLKKREVNTLLRLVEKDPKIKITINLPDQYVSTSKGGGFFFEIDSFRKNLLIRGLDEFGYLLNLDKKITEFEMNHRIFYQSS